MSRQLPPLRSIRLLPRTDYARFTGNRGEIFYDPVNDTLRVFDSETIGGSTLATRSWVTEQLPSTQGLASTAYVDQAISAIPQQPEYLLKIAAEDSTVLTVGRDETLQVKGAGFITATIGTDSTGIQLVIDGSNLFNEVVGNFITFSIFDPIIANTATLGYVDTIVTNLTNPDAFRYDLKPLSVQFQSGAAVDEFSTDVTFADNSSSAVPTESAVRGYIDRRLGFDADGATVLPANKIGPTYVTTDGQQTVTFGTSTSTTDADCTFNAEGVMLATWIASLSTTRSLNIINLTPGRTVQVYVRNTNGSSRTVNVQASATDTGLAAVNLAVGAGAVSATSVTLAANTGTAAITVFNAGGNLVGWVN